MAKTIGALAVYLADSDGVTHTFLPGQSVPSWAAKQMGDHCFARAGEVVDESDEYGDDTGPDDGEDEPDGPPSSRAGVKKWAAYAEATGVDVEGLDKAEIIASLENAGIPVE